MKVCIAEKPSVAKEIAHILGANTRNNGYYEGNGYQVTWTFGHLCTLLEPEDYNPVLKYWNIDNLPILPEKYDIKLIDNKGVKEQFDIIKRLFLASDEIINCGDAGQEGELIQRWVLKLTGCTKPVKRLWISSLTEEAIREGFNKLKDAKEYDKLFYAGSSRAIGDWLLGMNATRLYTKKYAAKGSVLSVGRVQTPTLAMIVHRHKEIEAFRSEDFWELKTKYKEVLFSSEKGKIKTLEEGNNFIQSIEKELFTITSFETKEGKESAPRLFDLTSLQVDCNKKLNLGADETLKIAQTLYERKYLTYPRVDTRYLPEDIYPKIEGILGSLKKYNTLVTPLIGKPIRKSKHVFDDAKVTDHHAIIPTNVSPNGLSPIENQVYDMVVLRFIANFYTDCIVSKTTVLGMLSEIGFKASGKQILDPGWRVVYGNEDIDDEDAKKKEEDESSQLMPVFIIGEKGPHAPILEQKQTSAPKYYSEATLLRAMETAGKQIDDEDLRELMKDNGIGRPSTRANIIQTLFKRQYIAKQRKNIVPTLTGIQLIDTIKHDMLKSAELTGRWEKNLQDIEKGKYSVKQFLFEMNQFVKEVVTQVKFDHVGTTFALEEAKKKVTPKTKELNQKICPKCKKGTIMKGKSAYGCSEHTSCDFRLPLQIANIEISEKVLLELLNKNKTSLIKQVEINNKKQNGHFFLNKSLNIEFKVLENVEWKCPKCKNGDIIKGNTAYGCNQFNAGCTFKIPFKYAGKILTEKQIESLVTKGRTPLIKGFEHKGEIFEGRITINKTNDLEFVKG